MKLQGIALAVVVIAVLAIIFSSSGEFSESSQLVNQPYSEDITLITSAEPDTYWEDGNRSWFYAGYDVYFESDTTTPIQHEEWEATGSFVVPVNFVPQNTGDYYIVAQLIEIQKIFDDNDLVWIEQPAVVLAEETRLVHVSRMEEPTAPTNPFAVLGQMLRDLFDWLYSFVTGESPETPPEEVCGDGVCEGSETYDNCPDDCAAPCLEAGETCSEGAECCSGACTGHNYQATLYPETLTTTVSFACPVDYVACEIWRTTAYGGTPPITPVLEKSCDPGTTCSVGGSYAGYVGYGITTVYLCE